MQPLTPSPMHTPKNGAACPQGCGETMLFFQEKQAGACRFCQGNAQQPIPGSNAAGQHYPSAHAMAPGYQSQPQRQYPPNVQLVKQNSPREMYDQTGDPRWLAAAEATEAAQSVPSQPSQPQARQLAAPAPMPSARPSAPPTGIEVSAVVRDFYSVIGVLMECVEKLNVIANAFSQVPAPPPLNVAAHHSAAGQMALTPEIANLIAQMMPGHAGVGPTAQTSVIAPLTPSTAQVGKLNCLACSVLSLGAPLDESKCPHTCEKGAANGKPSQVQSPQASPS